MLRRNGIPATFFFTGQAAAAHPEVVRSLAAQGFLIADHTVDHTYPRDVAGGWSAAYLTDQVDRARTRLRALSGQPVCYFRPPGGFTDNVLPVTSRLGMTTVLWSVDTLDWQQPGRLTPEATAAIVRAGTATTDPHPVVLMHSSKASQESGRAVSGFRGNTVAALPEIIAWYRAHGYRFVDLAGRSAG